MKLLLPAVLCIFAVNAKASVLTEVPIVEPGLTPAWHWVDLGTSIGQGIMEIADVNGDGASEMILAYGGTGFGPAQGVVLLDPSLERSFCSMPVSSVRDYSILQYDGDPALEILLASNSGVAIYDGASCRLQQRWEFTSEVQAVAVGDTDNDGGLEIVYSVFNDLHIASLSNPASVTIKRGFGGTQILVEPIDTMVGDDIVTSGTSIFLLNGVSLDSIQQFPQLFFGFVALGQLNQSVERELLIARPGSHIRAYDVINGELLLDHATGDLDMVRAFDLDGDEVDEILFGDGQWGGVHIIDSDGTQLYYVENPEHGVSNALVGSFAEGPSELFFGAGYSSTGPDHLYRADLATESIVWESVDPNGAYFLADPGDYDNVGGEEIAITYGARTDYDIGGAAVLDLATGLPKPALVSPSGSAGGDSIVVVDVDDDGEREICVSGINRTVSCHDLSGAIAQEFLVRETPSSMLIADVDNDGQHELVVADRSQIVEAFDTGMGWLKWQSEQLSSARPNTRSLQFDAGALWYIDPNGGLFEIDPTNGDILRQSDIEISAMSNQVPEGHLIGTATGEVGWFNSTTLNLVSDLFTLPGQVLELQVSPNKLILALVFDQVGSFRRLFFNHAYVLDLSGNVIWDGGATHYLAGRFSQDGSKLILSRNDGVLALSTSGVGLIFKDNFEAP